MWKKGWILLLILLMVAFLISCGKDTEPDEAKGELVKIEREGTPFYFFVYGMNLGYESGFIYIDRVRMEAV